jgi:hypothetical protein
VVGDGERLPRVLLDGSTVVPLRLIVSIISKSCSTRAASQRRLVSGRSGRLINARPIASMASPPDIVAAF